MTNVFSQTSTSAEEYFKNIFSFNGPMLSVAQASVGTYFGIMITKGISESFGFSETNGVDQVSLISWSIGSSIGLVGMGILGLYSGLPPYIYYPVPLVISLLAPKFLFNLTWAEEGLYVLIGTTIGLATHVLSSLFLGYNNYLPFWKIDPIWGKKDTAQAAFVEITLVRVSF
jgi:hypothetical protein